MFDFRVFENMSLSCFLGRDPKKQSNKIEEKIYRVSNDYNITVLPFQADFEIDNLYPITNKVELWNIFVVGNDKTYILANIKDPNIYVPHTAELLNHKSENILPSDLHRFFDAVWDSTLGGKQLQFCILWNNRLYLLNSYPFYNSKKTIVGATMFMRQYDSPRKTITLSPSSSKLNISNSSPPQPSEPSPSKIKSEQSSRGSNNKSISHTLL